MKAQGPILAVFEPSQFATREALESAIVSARLQQERSVSSDALQGILDAANLKWPRQSAWVAPPLFEDGVIVFSLEQSRYGNAAPWLRSTSAKAGLAVFDCATSMVFAEEGAQVKFEGADWNGAPTDKPSTEWPGVGSLVTHAKFGDGRVLDVGEFKGTRALVVEFADDVRLLDPVIGGQFMIARQYPSPKRTSSPKPAEAFKEKLARKRGGHAA